MFVSLGQARCYLPRNLQGVGEFQSRIDSFPQGGAFLVGHCDEQIPVRRFADFVNHDDVGMIERRR